MGYLAHANTQAIRKRCSAENVKLLNLPTAGAKSGPLAWRLLPEFHVPKRSRAWKGPRVLMHPQLVLAISKIPDTAGRSCEGHEPLHAAICS
jgi:hypothetical protein